MKKNMVWLLAILLLVASGALGCSAEAQETPGGLPTVVSAAAQTPAPTPPDSRKVAELTLVLQSDGDKVVNVELGNSRVFSSFAPNVFDVVGPWSVEVIGKRTLRYGILDPRQVEIEGAQEGEPLTTSIQQQATATLIVPLNDAEGGDLGVREIRVHDQNDNIVLAVTVDGDQITPAT